MPCSAVRSTDAELLTLIRQGRDLLEAGKAAEAEALFLQAAAQDGDSLTTRLWVLRSWMEQGRSDETLQALDALTDTGHRGVEMQYLYGMAFARRAEGLLASGTIDSSVPMLFSDAVALLREALEADRIRFADAALPLADSAWQSQDLETARWSVDQAVGMSPESAEAWQVRGRVCLSQFVAAEAEEKGGSRAETLWDDATGSFQRALDLLATPTSASDELRLADAATALARALLWREHRVEATEAFATAMTWAPETVDYVEAQRLLGSSGPATDSSVGFRAALESARSRFEARTGTERAREATLLWWLGWARFQVADWSASEEAFLACMSASPAITNAWFYVGLARQYRKDSEGALAAMHAGWDADPATMVSTAAAAQGSLRTFEGLLEWCASREPARNLDAAFLAELLTRAYPEEPRHWNNLGLFLRDEGERLEIAAHQDGGPAPDAALLSDLYERSYAAYEHALALTPDDPQVINDTALMLQYHLERDADSAEAMYRRSIALSNERLAAPDLSADDRARFEQTLSDATGNLERLLEPETVGAGAQTSAP